MSLPEPIARKELPGGMVAEVWPMIFNRARLILMGVDAVFVLDGW